MPPSALPAEFVLPDYAGGGLANVPATVAAWLGASIATLSHIYGWSSPAVFAELRALLNQFRVELLNALSPVARRGTVVCLLADHGQVATPPAAAIYAAEHPGLTEELLMRSAGEPRTQFLYARQGRVAAVRAYLRDKLHPAVYALGEKRPWLPGCSARPLTRRRRGSVWATSLSFAGRATSFSTLRKRRGASNWVGTAA